MTELPCCAGGVFASPAPMAGTAIQELTLRAVRGDTRASAELVRRLAPQASRIVWSLAGSAAAHDDLVQDALIALVSALPRFEGRASIETFLYGICVRVVRRHRRGIARLLRALERLVEGEASPAATEPEAEDDRSRAVRRLLDRLSGKRREVLILHEVEGRTAAEIAEILAIPEATVHTRLYHARRAFRRLAERDPAVGGGR